MRRLVVVVVVVVPFQTGERSSKASGVAGRQHPILFFKAPPGCTLALLCQSPCLSAHAHGFLPHDSTSCANAVLMKDWDVGLWQKE